MKHNFELGLLQPIVSTLKDRVDKYSQVNGGRRDEEEKRGRDALLVILRFELY